MYCEVTLVAPFFTIGSMVFRGCTQSALGTVASTDISTPDTGVAEQSAPGTAPRRSNVPAFGTSVEF